MFTTIENLRKSSAQQSRVTTVKNWMTKNYPGFTDTSLIPVFLIEQSNNGPDCDWVRSTSSVHVNPTAIKITKTKFEGRTVADRVKAGIEHYVDAWNKSGLPADKSTHAFFIAHTATQAQADVPAAAVNPNQVATTETVKAVLKDAPVGKRAAKQSPVKAAAAKPTIAAKTAAPAKATPPAKAAKPAPAAPVFDNKGKPVPVAQLQRINALAAKATSKDKRSKFLESCGVPFDRILIALAQQNLLPPGKIEAGIVSL